MFKRSLFFVGTFFLVSTNGLCDTVNLSVTGRVIASPCTVLNGGVSSLTVPLGDVQAKDLSTSGSRSEQVKFSIPVSGCPAGTKNVTVVFTGTPDTTTNTMWSNTASQAAPDTSIELTQQVTALRLSNNSSVTIPVTSGSASLDLAANMFTSTGVVTPGNVSTQVLLSFTYQ